jgi:hypothetical protein
MGLWEKQPWIKKSFFALFFLTRREMFDGTERLRKKSLPPTGEAMYALEELYIV